MNKWKINFALYGKSSNHIKFEGWENENLLAIVWERKQFSLFICLRSACLKGKKIMSKIEIRKFAYAWSISIHKVTISNSFIVCTIHQSELYMYMYIVATLYDRLFSYRTATKLFTWFALKCVAISQTFLLWIMPRIPKIFTLFYWIDLQ